MQWLHSGLQRGAILSKGFEHGERLTQEIQETLDEFMRTHWVFTQQEWVNKVNLIKKNVLTEFRAKITPHLSECYEFADFIVTDTAIDYVIEEMKGEI